MELSQKQLEEREKVDVSVGGEIGFSHAGADLQSQRVTYRIRNE